MEAGSLVAPGGVLPTRGPCSGVLCRNFARGACRWGQNCRFSHNRKSVQICRYFQNGFCGYGDRCSYRHIQEPPVPGWNGCGSQPASSLSYHGSQLAGQPEASAGSRGGARYDSEPPSPSVTQLELSFRQLTTAFAGEEKETVTVCTNPPNRGLIGECVPGQAPSGSGFTRQDRGFPRTALEPETASNKAVISAPRTLEAAGGLGAAAASVAGLRSEDVVCGICMDKVYEKSSPEERMFGILPNCSHAYCVGCISTWRKSREFQNAVIKACPECRVTSSYFIPHKYWVSDMDEKEKLIETFKARTGKIRCKFFARGQGRCPFKSDCIYLHELPAGGWPRRRRHPHRRSPFVFDPSESSEEEEDDMRLFRLALTFALLEGDADYLESDYSHETFWGSSDSD